jgi:hypothetical protein
VSKRHAQAPTALPKRGRGRPSKVEVAARAQAEAALRAAAAPTTTVAGLSLPPEPSERPILPPAPPPPPPPAPAQPARQDLSLLTTQQREDPRFLWGDALRDFAWRRGLSRSSMEDWDDEKVREQVLMIVRRQYDELQEV